MSPDLNFTINKFKELFFSLESEKSVMKSAISLFDLLRENESAINPGEVTVNRIDAIEIVGMKMKKDSPYQIIRAVRHENFTYVSIR